jgi:hypothetical protein
MRRGAGVSGSPPPLAAPSESSSPSDDAEDETTERGRALLRREAQAAASGMRIGEVLHSDSVGDEFPGLGPKKSAQGAGRARGWGGTTP